MSVAHQAALDAVESAVSELAAELAGTLRRNAGEFSLRDCADGLDEPVSTLGAVRGLGADVLAPFLLAGHVLTAEDAALVRAAVAAFPAPPPGTQDAVLWSARDEALVRGLAEAGVDASGWDGLAADRGDSGPEAGDWAGWSSDLVTLSSLALPWLDGPTRRQARSRRLNLTRAMVRAMLRRDDLSAARLARWIALDDREAPEPLLGTALDHIEALAVGRPRTLFEIAVARRLWGSGG